MGERLEEKSNQDSIQKIAKDDQLDHKHPQVKEKIAEDFSGSQKEALEKPSLSSLWDSSLKRHAEASANDSLWLKRILEDHAKCSWDVLYAHYQQNQST